MGIFEHGGEARTPRRRAQDAPAPDNLLALPAEFRQLFAPQKMSDQPPSATTASRPPGWLAVLGIAAAILGVPALLDQGAPTRQPFNERPLRALEKARPAGILVGDSMLESRIDPQVLTAAAGERWAVLSQPGSSSATWFLMFKNIIARQAAPPRTAVIFFRDRQLTLPAHRTEGGYRKTIETYMRGPEPVLDEILMESTRRQRPWTQRVALAVYPVQWRRETWRDRIQSWALDAVASSGEYARIRGEARAIFKLQNLRQDSGLDFEIQEGGQKGLDIEDHDFASAVPLSFLPRIIAVAREKNVRLVFFRVKRKPAAVADQPPNESRTLPAYVRELRAYVEAAGAQFVDETRDAEPARNFFGADDHVAPAMMKPYTELFWRKVGPLLEASAPAR